MHCVALAWFWRWWQRLALNACAFLPSIATTGALDFILTRSGGRGSWFEIFWHNNSPEAELRKKANLVSTQLLRVIKLYIDVF